MQTKDIKPLDNKVRELSANVFDTLELMAESMGGVGQYDWFASLLNDETGNYERSLDCPVCINGMAVSAGITRKERDSLGTLYEPSNATKKIPWSKNDEAVTELRSEGFGTYTAGYFRVPFDAYCAKLNIIRGA